MLWISDKRGTTAGRVVVRQTLPVALAAYAALLIVIDTVVGLPLVWSVMGPIVLAAVVGVCAAREYGSRGWRLTLGCAVAGAGSLSLLGPCGWPSIRRFVSSGNSCGCRSPWR